MVELNHGRWIARCPDCPSAMRVANVWNGSGGRLVKPDRMTSFLCGGCGNVLRKGRSLPLVWPRTWQAIEMAVAGRLPANRNWLPGESLSDLKRQNAEML